MGYIRIGIRYVHIVESHCLAGGTDLSIGLPAAFVKCHCSHNSSASQEDKMITQDRLTKGVFTSAFFN